MKSAQVKTNNAFEFRFQLGLFLENALEHISFVLDALINPLNIHLVSSFDRRVTRKLCLSTMVLYVLNRTACIEAPKDRDKVKEVTTTRSVFATESFVEAH